MRSHVPDKLLCEYSGTSTMAVEYCRRFRDVVKKQIESFAFDADTQRSSHSRKEDC